MELEIEVPGTPEEVWEAIATGPGTPPGCTRPRSKSEWKASEDEPPALLATEWLVEARAGGTCTVRMVTSGFGTGAGWDQEIEGFTEAMRAALDVLRAYLTDFPGRRGTWMRAFGQGKGSLGESWSELTGALGLDGGAPGESVGVGDGPSLTGVVEREARGTHLRDLLFRIEDPAPGLAQVGVFSERRYVAVQACLYGEEGAVVAKREQPAWEAWMQEGFAA